MGFYEVSIILFFTVASIGVHEIFRRSSLASWFSFLVLPLLLTPLWLERNAETSWFLWVKNYSVITAVLFLSGIRFISYLRERTWPYIVIYLFLVLNISEAVVAAFLKGPLGYPNAVAGLLLIATLPSYKHIKIDRVEGFRDFLWDIPYGWILGYTLWNWVFSFLVIPEFAGYNIAVLGAPLVISLYKRQLWVQARALTLGANLLCGFTFPWIYQTFNTTPWYNETAGLIASTASLLWMVVYGLYGRYRQRSNKD